MEKEINRRVEMCKEGCEAKEYQPKSKRTFMDVIQKNV